MTELKILRVSHENHTIYKIIDSHNIENRTIYKRKVCKSFLLSCLSFNTKNNIKYISPFSSFQSLIPLSLKAFLIS